LVVLVLLLVLVLRLLVLRLLVLVLLLLLLVLVLVLVLLAHGRLPALVLTWLAYPDVYRICCCFPSHPGVCSRYW
jgi:hypothetical protein